MSISHHEIKSKTNIWLKSFNSAKEKYDALGKVLLEVPFQKSNKTMNVRGKNIQKEIATYNKDSNKKGILVCTGDINNKKNEFLFISHNKKIRLAKSVVDDFKSVYFNDNSIDGRFWENKFKEIGKIPIFYKRTKRGDIQAIGLTQLFKLAYNKSIHQAIVQNKSDKLDMAQAIFGIQNDKISLKGRVFFSHLKSTHIRFENQKTKEEILGTPNPSYYPNYIEQTDLQSAGRVNDYITLMDKDAVIRGYKRYPLHKNIGSSFKTNENEKIVTQFKPLDSGSRFVGKVRFHNLKKAEIGALLSAMTFHGNSDKYYHNLGMAKALGYGKIELKIELKNLKYTQKEYLDEFEKKISTEIEGWKDSPQLRELFAMSDESRARDELLVYQRLKNDKKRNEFVDAKKAREYLVEYSKYGSLSSKSSYNSKKRENISNKSQKIKKDNSIDDLQNYFGSVKTPLRKRGLTIVKKKNQK